MNNRRMIYVYDENLDIYDSIPNKSEWINDKIRLLGEKIKRDKRKSPREEFEDQIKKQYGSNGTV